MEDSLLPFTSLCHNLTQADLDFLIFVQRNKTGTALCNLSIKNLVCTIWPQHHRIRVSKGDSQLSGCQIAQSRDSFCDLGRKLENLSMPAYSQWCSATDGRTRLHEPWKARWTPFTSLREILTQAYLVFLIFEQRNKTDTALCNLTVKKLKSTFWHPNPMN